MNKIQKNDMFAIYLILINLFFLRYIKVFYETLYYFDIVFLIYIVAMSFNSKIKIRVVSYFSILFLIIVIALNAFEFGFNHVFVNNLLMVFSPSIYILFLGYLINKYKFETLEMLANHLRKFMNFYFIINTIIIYIQAQTGTFMMKKFLGFNTNAIDHTDGLIGANGVGVLNFLWIATLMYNLYFYLHNKRKKSILIILIVQVILMANMSSLNENKMFFITLLPFFFSFLIIKGVKFNLTLSSTKIAMFFIIIPIILMVILNSSTIKDTTNESTLLVEDFFHTGSMPNPNNERSYLNYLAFNEYNANNLGVGLQSIDLANQTIHVHLGINSSSLVLIQGGIYYLFAVINFYCILILNFFSRTSIRKKIIIYLLLVITITNVSFASQIFRDQYLFTSLMLIYFVLFLTSKKMDYRENAAVILKESSNIKETSKTKILIL